MVLKVPSAQKKNVVSVEKSMFQFFISFSLTKLKWFLEKVRQSFQSYLKQNLIIGSFLESDFRANLMSKTSVVSVWKEHFSVSCNALSDKGETILWEGEGKRSTLSKSKIGHRNLLRKCFWSYLELK